MTAWGNVQWNSHFPWAIIFPLVRLLSKRWNFCYLESRIAKANRLLLNRVTRESYSLQSPTRRSSARKWYNFQGLGILLYINSCKYFFRNTCKYFCPIVIYYYCILICYYCRLRQNSPVKRSPNKVYVVLCYVMLCYVMLKARDFTNRANRHTLWLGNDLEDILV